MNLLAMEQDESTDVRRWAGRLIVVLIGLALFRMAALYFNSTDLFFDEAQYWSWSLEPALGYYSKPPMIAWLIGLSTGVCGSSEFCVRLPSPLLHSATSLAVFTLGWRLYDARTGFWSGVVYATLPGVSLSAGLISTDVPLLLFWAIALVAFAYLLEDKQRWWPAGLLGVALGLGLISKYAMAYFVLCALIYFFITPKQRHLLRDVRWWGALAIGLAIMMPNLVWNVSNGFATFAHTADNAKWTGIPLNPVKAIEFLAAQFGVFGPILFGALLVIAWRAYKGRIPDSDRMLVAFALPVIAIVTVQAFISRAHANWAAVSYVAATVLVTATMIRELSWTWLRASLMIHVAALVGLAIVVAHAGSFRLPNGQDPFARTMGWENLANVARKQLDQARKAGQPYGSVLTLDRSVTAELLYYMRAEKTPIRAWPPQGRPRDHYQLTRAYRGKLPDPILLVSIGGIPIVVSQLFETVKFVAVENIPAGSGAPRRVVFARLSGYKR